MDETKTENSTENQENTEQEKPELREARWSVISFDKCEAQNLTYEEAERKIEELAARKFSGLCIVTDEVAAKMQ
ncbi:MAG: hypothetical protein LUM44_09325 [Pyrinomonadaceae bacterium]|nr:hypothetical protein [Pyrinomonadaceae bacterium]